jgi:hypothetical protein
MRVSLPQAANGCFLSGNSRRSMTGHGRELAFLRGRTSPETVCFPPGPQHGRVADADLPTAIARSDFSGFFLSAYSARVRHEA